MTKGIIAVSLRSKGLPSFNPATFFDGRHQFQTITRALQDFIRSFLLIITCLSWSSWMSIGITVISVAAFNTSQTIIMSIEGFMPFGFIVLLPVLMLIMMTFQRREAAVQYMSCVKAYSVAICNTVLPSSCNPDQKAAMDSLKEKVFALLEDMHQYLAHHRPYCVHFFTPFRASDPGPGDPLYTVSREIGILLRKVHRAVREVHLSCQGLREVGVSDVLAVSLSAQVTEMHVAIEKLSGIKEMRTPVFVRALVRWYTNIFLPIFLGPLWNYINLTMNQSTFTGVMTVMAQIALLVLVDTAVYLEDPFDDANLDTLSLFEAIDQINAMTLDTNDYNDPLGSVDAGPGPPTEPALAPTLSQASPSVPPGGPPTWSPSPAKPPTMPPKPGDRAGVAFRLGGEGLHAPHTMPPMPTLTGHYVASGGDIDVAPSY